MLIYIIFNIVQLKLSLFQLQYYMYNKIILEEKEYLTNNIYIYIYFFLYDLNYAYSI